MNNLNQYKLRFLELFADFLSMKIDEQTFIQKLYSFEMKIKSENDETENEDCSLWFRFFKGDTLATTIRDIKTDLIFGNTSNHNFMIENLKLAIELNELEIYLS